MKWYHLTGINEFEKIVDDEALLPVYERWRREAGNKIDIIERTIENIKKTKSYNEFQRNSYVFLKSSDDSSGEARKDDLLMCFDLPYPLDRQVILVPEVSLEYFINLSVKRRYLSIVKNILKKKHNGKYKEIPIIRIT